MDRIGRDASPHAAADVDPGRPTRPGPAGRLAALVLGAVLAACGSGGSDTSTPAPVKTYVGSSGTFVGWADPDTGRTGTPPPTNSYAGKRSVTRGTVDYLSGTPIGVLAGVEVYKRSDGGIYALNLAGSAAPVEKRLSSESQATIDGVCSQNGLAVPGANVDYVGVQFAVDLQRPNRSAYIYRLPGSRGTCNTSVDIVRAVFTGMSATDAPRTLPGMPAAVVRNGAGGITGYVIKRANRIELLDAEFANPVVLGTFGATVDVLMPLPTGTSRGYPTRELFLVDGTIRLIDYAARSVSAPLFTIPGWQPTSGSTLFAASPTQLHVSVFTPAAGTAAASSTLYAMPSDGSATPAVIATESGRVIQMDVSAGGTQLVWAVQASRFAIRTLPAASPGTPVTLVDGGTDLNSGYYLATTDAVFYTAWLGSRNTSLLTNTRTGTASGIVRYDSTTIQPRLAASAYFFANEFQPWPDDPTVTSTALRTVLQVRGLSTIVFVNPSDGYLYTEDGISGGTLVAIDPATRQVTATLGRLPAGTARGLTGNFRAINGYAFVEGVNSASDGLPVTRDLYLINTGRSDSLLPIVRTLL